MEEHYREESYFAGGGTGYSSYLAQEPTLRRTFRRLLDELERRGMTGGRLLEVGCAYGFFLDEACTAFAERVGTELSQTALEHARARADRVVLGGLAALGPSERFDLAACIHVIEHVYDPVDFLGRIRERLEPGGWVVVATPDMGGVWRRLMGHRWPYYKPPEHVAFYDRRSLARLLQRAGFGQLQWLPYVSYFSLELIGEKLGVRIPAALARLQVRLPASTLALAGCSD